jgi:hypothetical protein
MRAFAEDAYEEALVEDASQQALSGWGKRVTRHDVAADVG